MLWGLIHGPNTYAKPGSLTSELCALLKGTPPKEYTLYFSSYLGSAEDMATSLAILQSISIDYSCLFKNVEVCSADTRVIE